MERPSSIPGSVDSLRWPLETREAFYVSGNFQSFDPKEPHLDGNGAEALFIWDGDDGLENGEYVLYLVMGDDLRTLRNAHFASGGILLTEDDAYDEQGEVAHFGLSFVERALGTEPEERIVDVEVFTDRNGDRKVWAETTGFGLLDGDPQTPELNDGDTAAASETFGLEAGLQPDASGIIRYGVIQVENNYLAVMLRNWADAGNINMFSRVILAPRDRTPGRININTVQTRRIANTNLNRGLFNPLVGLPGVLARPNDFDSVGPADRFLALPPGFLTENVPLFEYVEPNVGLPIDQAQDLARQIVERRHRSAIEAPDGRYYELTSDLLADAHGLVTGNNIRPPLVIANHREFIGDGSATNVFSNDITVLDRLTPPGSDRDWAFRESAYRFSRMQNLISTRSDVFEIQVTVQAGYGTDTNGDGRINYRDDREFTATAEKSARTVYER